MNTKTINSFIKIFILILLLNFVLTKHVFADTAGPFNGSTAVDDASAGTIAWTTPSNVLVNDASYATVSITGNGSTWLYSHNLKVTGFGFNIPSTAIINGIVVETKGFTASGTTYEYANLVKNGVVVGTQAINPTMNGSEIYRTQGSSTDLWGTTWTPADINSANFGIAMSQALLTAATFTWNYNHVRITVYYTPQTPTVISPTSASITNSSATLGGNITSQGGAALTARGVCYSVTATNANPQSGGVGVTCTPEGGTATGVFTQSITGLTANTPYSFEAYATNSFGTTYTSAGTFTTYGPPTVTTSAASNTTTSSTALNSIVNPNSASTNVSYLWGTSNVACSLLPNTLAGPTALTGAANISPNIQVLSGLTGNTAYYFCAMATNSYGTTYGSVLSVTTNNPATSAYTWMDAGSALGGGATDCNDASAAPCQPTGGSATAASGTQMNVSWTAGVGPAATSYNLVWCSGASCTPGTTITGVTSVYAHTGLTCGTTYGYNVIPVNASGSGPASATFYGSTTCGVPPTVTTTAANNLAGTQAMLNSTINPNGYSTNVTYRYGTTNVACASLPSTLAGPTGLTGSSPLSVASTRANLTGLTSGTTYYFCATATNSGGTTNGTVLSFVANSGSHPMQDNIPSMTTWAALGGQTDYGWSFTPTHDGQITELWGYVGGSETVELWNRDSGVLLASGAITSNSVWTKVTLTPVTVLAGTVYSITATTTGNPMMYYAPAANFGVGIYGGAKVFRGVGGGALSTVQRTPFGMMIGTDITYIQGTDACHTLYPDGDNDGYALSTGAVSQCSGVASVNYVNNTNLNSTTTDCYDANANAFPNQNQGFTTNRGDGSFDYNCNGVVDYNSSYPPFQICNDAWGTSASVTAYNLSGTCGVVGNMPKCASVGAAGTQTTCGGTVTYQPGWYNTAACTAGDLFWYAYNQQLCR